MSELTTDGWSEIADACNEMDQMVTSTVMKACDIGDMLRRERAKTSYEFFTVEVHGNLSRGEQWTRQMMDLSFRREAVQAALGSNDANDSINSMHKHIKALPRSEAETAERKSWPKQKIGRKAGGKNVKNPKPENWVCVAQSTGLLPEDPTKKQKEKAKEKITNAAGGDLPTTKAELERVCVTAAVRANPVAFAAKAETEAEEVERLLSMTAEERVQTAIRARMRKIDAEVEIAIAGRVKEELADMLVIYRRDIERARKTTLAYKGPLTKQEYKLLLGILHTDRLPDIDDVQKKRYEKAFILLQDKRTELVGVDEAEISGTLPKTVDELRAMRKKK